ncbi:hypothetical protein D9M71_821290 [compost metagenome]
MEFQDWMNSLSETDAPAAAAEKLGEKRRTVLSWVRFERVPSFSSAMNIVRVSEGLVDFNGVYDSHMKKKVAEHAGL